MVATEILDDFDEFREALAQAFRIVFDSVAGNLRLWDYQPIYELHPGDSPGSLQGQRVLRRIVTSSTVVTCATSLRLNAPKTFLPALVAHERARHVILGSADPNNLDHVGTALHNDLLGTFVHRYLERLGDRVEWHSRAFNDTFDELVAYMLRDYDTLVCTATLNNFKMGAHRIDIRADLWIEEFTWAERQEKHDELSLSSIRAGWNDTEVMRVEYVLRCTTDVDRANDALWESVRRVQDVIRLTVRALRLMSPGLVSSRMSWWGTTAPRFSSISPGTHWSMAFPPSGPGMCLDVEEETPAILSTLVEKLGNDSPDGGFDVALRRFEDAYERSSDEDRIIDYWIGLEALFTTVGERTETSDKLSRRIARLLGDTPEARRDMFRTIKGLYTTRSRLVHGSPGETNRVASDTTLSADLLRRALRTRLLTRWSVKQLEDLMMK